MLSHERISAVPLFSGLSEGSLRLLAQHGLERSFAAGETLFRSGDTPWGLYVILEGRVRVVRGQDGRNVVVHTEGAGGTLADVPFFAGGALPGTAVAMEPTCCAIFPQGAIRAAIEASPDVAFTLLARLAQRVRDVVTRLDQITSNSVASRLAAYIVRRSDERKSPLISLGMTQGELAEELGTVREVIVRELRDLRDRDIIRRAKNGWLEIVDPAALRALAGKPA